MKTAVERLVEWLEKNHPEAVPGIEVVDHLRTIELLEQQKAYNAGFIKAKSIYLDGE